MTRSGLTAGEVEAIGHAGRHDSRRAAADDVVLNDRELDALAPQNDGLHRQILNWPWPNFRAGR
ncbi:MAG: hypothetical protein IPN78_04385 [Candidatus Accumulibacter sp.]|nr:hypothetical protein [Candidatus Accumulibacter propinquus]